MDTRLARVESPADVAICEGMWIEYADWATQEYVTRFGDIVDADHDGMHATVPSSSDRVGGCTSCGTRGAGGHGRAQATRRPHR